ncbi:MAG: hypothetical protein HY619_06280 [Thaumarchaeota archaeon]|nr:hypothetical protein [Nitrososphaerota archaeon]
MVFVHVLTMKKVSLRPIGVIKSPLKDGPVRDREEIVSELVVDLGFAEGLGSGRVFPCLRPVLGP